MRKVLGCALALVVAVGARAAEEPAAIVEKAIKAHGGKEKLAKVKAEQWKGKGVMTMGDQKLPYAISYAFQQPDHPGLADAGLHFQPQAGQPFGHKSGRA